MGHCFLVEVMVSSKYHYFNEKGTQMQTNKKHTHSNHSSNGYPIIAAMSAPFFGTSEPCA